MLLEQEDISGPQAGSDTGLLMFLGRGRRGPGIIKGPECVLKWSMVRRQLKSFGKDFNVPKFYLN